MKINDGIVTSRDGRLDETSDCAGGPNARAPGCELKRLHLDAVLAESEMSRTRPRNWSECAIARYRFTQQKAGLVPAMQERITHVDKDIIHNKIERNFPILPKQFTIAHFQLVDRKREQIFYRRIAGAAFSSWRGLVRGSIGIHNDVNRRMFKYDGLEGESRGQYRGQFEADHEAIYVSVGYFSFVLKATYG